MVSTRAALKRRSAGDEPTQAVASDAEQPPRPRFVIRGLTKLRLKAVWLVIPVFFFFARPTLASLAIGATLAALGNVVRAWAAGTIHKNVVLTVGGPYAHTRNPLYLGTLLIGLGLTVASGRWFLVAGFLGFFAIVYGMAIRSEAHRLERVFGSAYREYARHVPLLLPRLRRQLPHGINEGSRFRLERYVRNKEYQTLLGVVLALIGLAAKLLLF